METVLDAMVILLWVVFSLATILGVIHEFRTPSTAATPPDRLEDDDPVYLLEPKAKSHRKPQPQV